MFPQDDPGKLFIVCLLLIIVFLMRKPHTVV